MAAFGERRFTRKTTDEVQEGAPEVSMMTPTMAASVLYDYLPKDVQEIIEEIRKRDGYELWHLFLGCVMKVVVDRQELLADRFVLTSWEEARKPSAGRPCRTCGQMFVSRWPDALYCCGPCYFGKLDSKPHAENCLLAAGVTGA